MKLNPESVASHVLRMPDRARLGGLLASSRQINTTPLQVRYPHGVREVLSTIADNMSVSTADLTRMLTEEALRDMLLPCDNATGRIIRRTEYLMRAHDITAPALASLLAPWNIRLSVLQDPERLADYLTAEALNYLAGCFFVNPEWLHGRETVPVARTGEWPVTFSDFMALISGDDKCGVYLWQARPFAGSAREYGGVLLRHRITRQGVTIHPVLSLLPVPLTDGIRDWYARVPAQLENGVRPCTLTPDSVTAESLIIGRILPADCLRTALLHG